MKIICYGYPDNITESEKSLLKRMHTILECLNIRECPDESESESEYDNITGNQLNIDDLPKNINLQINKITM